MDKVRAKFRCHSVRFHGKPEDEGTQREFGFSAVTDSSTPENERYSRYTPSAQLTMYVDNPAVKFEVGRSYYLDFMPAED